MYLELPPLQLGVTHTSSLPRTAPRAPIAVAMPGSAARIRSAGKGHSSAVAPAVTERRDKRLRPSHPAPKWQTPNSSHATCPPRPTHAGRHVSRVDRSAEKSLQMYNTLMLSPSDSDSVRNYVSHSSRSFHGNPEIFYPSFKVPVSCPACAKEFDDPRDLGTHVSTKCTEVLTQWFEQTQVVKN